MELIVTVYNINAGCNRELMEACRTLKEYAQYVEQVRKRAQEKELPQAVEEKRMDEIDRIMKDEIYRKKLFREYNI